MSGRYWDRFDDRSAKPPAITGPLLWPRRERPISRRCPTGNLLSRLSSPGRDPIVSRHSDGISYPMPGPKPQGDRALTSAERMRRLREKRKAEAADKPPDKPPVVIRYRRPKDRRSRPDQWADAINTLTDCLDTTCPPVLPTARSPNASTPCWSCATSLISYRLPICRADSDGTENTTTMSHPK
jgi:hypothetical protein